MTTVPVAQRELFEPFDAHGKYLKISKLGSGAFGSVYLGLNTETQEHVAVKLIERGQKITKYVEREILNHRLLWHPHVIQFREVFLTQTHLCIVIEYAPNGNMYEYVIRKQGLSEDEARYFFQQLILGLEYCHKRGIASRDIKLENILLDDHEAPLLKIADFGYSKNQNMSSACKSQVGTFAYAAPEVITSKSRQYDGQKADVWSSGVALYAMLFARYPFERLSDEKLGLVERRQRIIDRITRAEYVFPPGVSITGACQDLFMQIFEVNPAMRISLQEIMQHPWFLEGLPEEALHFNKMLPDPPVGAQGEAAIRSFLQEARTVNSEFKQFEEFEDEDEIEKLLETFDDMSVEFGEL